MMHAAKVGKSNRLKRVLLFVGAHVWALVAERIDFGAFVSNVGPMAGMLLGYWVRGQKAS